MDNYDVKRFALVLAVQAEIEGMKAANMQRQVNGDSMAYNETHFTEMSNRLSDLAYTHNEQL